MIQSGIWSQSENGAAESVKDLLSDVGSPALYISKKQKKKLKLGV